MEKLSIVVPYFNQERQLDWFLETIQDYKSNLLELIVVDDCSTQGVPLKKMEAIPFPAKVIRINTPQDWGMTGASNWGFTFATGKRVLKIDIDHRIMNGDIQSYATIQLASDELIRFPRVLWSGGKDKPASLPLAPHSNSFLIQRDSFLGVGMYDERFSGNYGYDDKDFFERLRGRLQVRVDNSLCLEMRPDHSSVGNRSRTINRLRHRFGRLGRAPRRLRRDASLVFSNSY